MTREEAIAYGNDYYKDLISACCKIDKRHKEFVRMSLEALKQEPSGDCVSRQAVIEQARDYGSKTFLIPVNSVKAMPPITPTLRWIPVSERLPEEEGLYLVSVKNEHDRRYSKTCWFHGNGKWFARQDVIAWMTLPKPYKAEMESEE